MTDSLTARVTARLTDEVFQAADDKLANDPRWLLMDEEDAGEAKRLAYRYLRESAVAAISPELQDAEAEMARLKEALHAVETKLIREWSHRESHQP